MVLDRAYQLLSIEKLRTSATRRKSIAGEIGIQLSNPAEDETVIRYFLKEDAKSEYGSMICRNAGG